MSKPAKALISYSHKDEAYRLALISALSASTRSEEMEIWSDHKILAGGDIDEEILAQLKEADIVILLISQDFIASDYCFKKELGIALERHKNGRCQVVPIKVRPSDTEGMPFAKLKMLPYDAKAVSIWQNQDEAWLDVAKSIRTLIRALPSDRDEHRVVDSKSIKSRLIESFDRLQARYVSQERKGVTFGFDRLDRDADGIDDGELVLVASRPDHGHTELLLSIATNAALEKKKVLVLSQRLTANQYTNQMLCSVAYVPKPRFLRGLLEDEDWSRISSAIRLLKEADFTIDDDLIRSYEDLKRKLKENSKKGFNLIIIDGIEYAASGLHGQEKQISGALKNFAREESVSVVVTLTLGAELEDRMDKRPLLKDLSEWSFLGECAEKIVACYSREHYEFQDTRRLVETEVSFLKNLNGPLAKEALLLNLDVGAIFSHSEKP